MTVLISVNYYFLLLSQSLRVNEIMFPASWPQYWQFYFTLYWKLICSIHKLLPWYKCQYNYLCPSASFGEKETIMLSSRPTWCYCWIFSYTSSDNQRQLEVMFLDIRNIDIWAYFCNSEELITFSTLLIVDPSHISSFIFYFWERKLQFQGNLYSELQSYWTGCSLVAFAIVT